MAGAFQTDAFQGDTFQVEAGLARTAADSVSSVSEAPTRVATYVRTAGDSVSAITEAATRVATSGRTSSDSISSISEAVEAESAIARTVADSIGSLTETVTRAGSAFVRTTGDALATLTESVARIATYPRAVADSVSSLTEAVAALRTVTRTVSQSLGSITESVSRAAMSVARSVAQTLGVISDGPSGAGGAGGPTGHVTHTGLAGTGIYVNGVNIAKADGDPVMFTTARFVSAVNGVAGTASFRARDDLGTAVYTPGDPLELVIDGNRVWTGFITNVKRVYAFPALNVDDFGPTRFFDIEGADLNILFARRIAFNQSDPDNILAPLYGPETPDVTAISALVSDWLDLSGDGLDVSTLVEHVSEINADQDARGWSGSDTWGQAMSSIALLPAAIFYIDPNWRLVYTDTDTPTAPYGLSDQPNGTTLRGYREMEILLDGSNLANDVMCWGIGYGSNTPVFVRDEDAASQATHGLWQLGQVTFGIYKQATINRVADSILNGSPDNRRGAKDDRPAVTVTTYQSGFLPAQKVDFRSEVFGWSDVIPIRKMEVTFEAPDVPKYVLTLSHEIDTPWSFFDPWRLSLPRLGRLKPLPPWPPFPEPEEEGGCTPAICGITDTFDDRTVSATASNDELIDIGAGMSTSGLVWGTRSGPGEVGFVYAAPSGSASLDVVGGRMRQVIEGGDGSTEGAISQSLPSIIAAINGQSIVSPSGFAIRFVIRWNGSIPDPSSDWEIGATAYCPLTGGQAYILWSGDGDLYLGDASSAENVPFTPTPDVDYIVRFEREAGVETRVKVWESTDPEPGSWTLVRDISGGDGDWSGGSAFDIRTENAGVPGDILDVEFENLDITGVNRCTEYRFDNFNRTVSYGSGWSAGWSGFDDYSGVNGTEGYALNGAQTYLSRSGTEWQQAGGFSMLIKFRSPTAIETTGTTQANEFNIFDPTGSDAITVGWTMANDPGESFGTFYVACFINTGGGTNAVAFKNDWVANQTYYVRWEWGNNVSRARIWAENAAEPTGWDVSKAWDVGEGSIPSSPASTLEYISDQERDWYYDWIDFDYEGKPCYDGGPPPDPPSPGGPMYGPRCELATRIDSTHYQLAMSVSPGTTNVTVGTPGYLYLPGIARDYTCADATGILTFNDVVAEADRVYVCYTAAGPL